MEKFRQEIAKKIAPFLNMSSEAARALMEVPPNPAWGDIAIPCFSLAKTLRKAPQAIALDLAKAADFGGLASRVEAMGGYLNITLEKTAVARYIAQGILHDGASFGFTNKGAGKTVVIDFSSPNIAKPFGIGHLRTTVIGHSLSRIYSELGYRVVRVNHLGDWGTQFGKLIVAYKLLAKDDELTADPIGTLFRIYVEFHRRAESSPELLEEARVWFRRLEEGDEEARSLWQRFVEVSLKEYQRVYDLLGVEFDYWLGESYYEPLLASTVAAIEGQDLTTVSDGAVIVDLADYGMPPCLLRKTDGATLYATRDIAAALYRDKKHHPELMLYVVGQEQTLHFKQVKQVLTLMRTPAGEKLVHVPFGLFKFPEGKMSTRRGNVIFLEDVLARAVDLALEVIHAKNPELENKRDIAQHVGVGAVVFGDLKHGRIKDVLFDWDEMLNFDGETGPYVQYTHARACSILRKAAVDPALSDEAALTEEYALPLIKLLGEFPQIIARSACEYEPSVVARYVLDVASLFNRYYHNVRILGGEKDAAATRLAVVLATQRILARGLYLLGLTAVDKM
ncbi:MAG: Arginine--tRNA ligase [Firmicutes bacterium]|nr:Arginine--tRNA ligase [candidate division NPL-UPA2 bacterium]